MTKLTRLSGIIAASLCTAFAFECTGPVRAQEIELVGHIDPLPGASYTDVWGEGDYAYMGSEANDGIFIIDISNPANPRHVATYPYSEMWDVKVANGIGYFASQAGGGVHIVDLTDPTSPTLLKQLAYSDNGFTDVHNVSVFGDFLYETPACCSGTTIKVFDISTPSVPQFVRDIGTRPEIHDMTALGNRLYTSSLGGYTQIYDVSQMSPDQGPTLLGEFASGSATHSNWVTDDDTVLASARECARCGVALIDISDPANPVLQSRIRAGDFGIPRPIPHNPLIAGDFLYVSWFELGLQVFDISNPANPIRVGDFDTYHGKGVGFVGNWGVYPFLGTDRVLLSDRQTGLYIVDVSAVVPEPATSVLSCFGLLAALLVRRSRCRCPRPKPGSPPADPHGLSIQGVLWRFSRRSSETALSEKTKVIGIH